jgi:hypothetical protein
MFSPRPPLIAAFIALALIGCGFFVMRACTKLMEKPVVHTINEPSDANTIWRADKPLSHAEALAQDKCPIPPPPEATNIQYVDFYNYGFMHCVRFEAPVSVCQAYAATVMKSFNQQMEASQNNTRVADHAQPLNRASAASAARFAQEQVEDTARADWFAPDTIVHGEMWGRHDSHTPLVLIDTDKGVFYYLRTD